MRSATAITFNIRRDSATLGPDHLTMPYDLVLEPNWKQAAAQESVDYQAVESTFMTQAYGFVANKAKVLFRDPFRLGFEIVHRNEKATKMVGIFAFRCNNSLLYAPVFFVNGEIKGADMLYRSEVKRFVPLTDEWCSFLVRGANEESGVAVRRGQQRRQQDANMDRLAYPQRTKYAGRMTTLPGTTASMDVLLDDATELEKKAASDSFYEMFDHCAQEDKAPRLLLPSLLADGGPDAFEKLASLIENSDLASRFVAENYAADDLTLDPDWCVKKASAAAAAVDPLENYRGSVVLVSEPEFAKSAADRKGVTDHGYALEDYRELESVNATFTYLDNPEITELLTPGVVSALDSEGNAIDILLAAHDDNWIEGHAPRPNSDDGARDGPRAIIVLGKPCEIQVTYRKKSSLIGAYKEETTTLEDACVTPSAAKVGKAYVLLHKTSFRVSEVFRVAGKEGKVIRTESLMGGSRINLIYKKDAELAEPERGYLNDDYALLEIKVEKENEDQDWYRTVFTKALMSPNQLDNWLRTGGGLTHSKDITVTKEPSGLFTLSAQGSDGFRKVARDLSRLGAHLDLCGPDYEMSVNAAGELLNFAEDRDTTRFRLYSTTKSGYVTRMRPEAEWQTGYDPVLNARIEMPQRQVVGTDTPERPQQDHRIGDRYMGEGRQGYHDPEEDGLPSDAIMSQSPDQLAQMAQKYDLPHIFDHQVVGSLAGNTYDTIEQVRHYVPDLETGVDRYARTLFLLRYRPADFEEAYGKDELMEMEAELTSLFTMAGKSLLRMLKRFDSDKFAPQADS